VERNEVCLFWISMTLEPNNRHPISDLHYNDGQGCFSKDAHSWTVSSCS
jgi:hypothetical protein